MRMNEDTQFGRFMLLPSNSNKDYIKQNIIAVSPINRKNTSKNKDEFAVPLKQTTCAACMEKWKNSLPIPRTPQMFTKKKLEHLLSSNIYLTDNNTSKQHHNVSHLINEELFKLKMYYTKFQYSKKNRSGDMYKFIHQIDQMTPIRVDYRQQSKNSKTSPTAKKKIVQLNVQHLNNMLNETTPI